MTPAETTPDLSYIRESPDYCWHVIRRKDDQFPCSKPAVAVRLDFTESEKGDPYPVCKYHSAGQMVPLRALFGAENRGGRPAGTGLDLFEQADDGSTLYTDMDGDTLRIERDARYPSNVLVRTIWRAVSIPVPVLRRMVATFDAPEVDQ